MTDNDMKPTCNTCMHNKVCDHNKYGFETCCSYVPNLEAPCDSAIFLSVWSKYINDVIKLKDDEIKRLDTALSVALKFNSELEADKRLANVELNRLNQEVARLTSDNKTLSAVLSRDVESDKEAVMAFIAFLEENAKVEVFKRPKINLDCEAKFLYLDDIKKLAEEFWEGDKQC